MTRKTGKIPSIAAHGGPRTKAKLKTVAKAAPKMKTGTITGQTNVAKYKKFISADSQGRMTIDQSKLAAAAKVGAAAGGKPKSKAKLKSAGAPAGESWRNDPNDSRNNEDFQKMDPRIVEEQNRLRNAPAPTAPPMMPAMHLAMPHNLQQQNSMQQHYQQQMFSEQFEPFYPDYPSYGAGGVVEIPFSRGVGDWKKPNQASLGVLTPEDIAAPTPATSGSSDGVLTFFSTLSTKEMIALACGGAGFFLFIVVIVIIIFKVRKRKQKRTKKQKDADRAAWVSREQSALSEAPAGFQPYRTLPTGEKDADHIARIQARNLPPPPALSFTQSAGVTGTTTASGSFMTDDRPSTRHRDW